MGKNQVTLTFAGDDKDLKRKLDDVGDGTDRMSRRVDQAGTRMQRAGIDAKELGGHLGRMALIAGTAAIAVAGAFAMIGKASIETFVEAQTQQAKLEDAYKRFPAIASVNIEAFRKLNNQRMQTTRFDDDASAAAEATLAQYKLTGKQIMTLLPLVQDYAAKTGKDLPEAAQLLGNALLGKGRALAEIGIKFKDAGSVTKNYTQLVEGLRKQVGGFAEQEGRTAAGQLEILKNRFGEVEEAIGERLLPIVSRAVDGLATLAELGGQKFDEIVSDVDGLSLENLPGLEQAFKDVGKVVTDELGESFTKLKGWIKENKDEIDKFVGHLSGFVKDTGPALKVTIDVLAVSFLMGANNVMLLVDGLDRLKDWYMKNISWLSPWANLMLKLSGANLTSAGQTMTKPNVPRFHDGGVVPGPAGSEMLAIVQAGETITPPGGGGGGRAVIELRSSGSDVDNFLMNLLRRAIDGQDVNVVLAGGPR